MKQAYLPKLLLLLCFVFLISACREDSPEPARPAAKELLDGEYLKSVAQNSAVFQYSLSSLEGVETGVYVSTDSSALTTPDSSVPYTKASFDEKGKFFTAEVVGLAPYTTYWYTIKIKDFNYTTHTKKASFTTLGFNLKWQEGFSKKIKLVEPLYRDLILTGENVDTDINNYEVMYGEMPCDLWKIAKVESSLSTFMYYVQVPTAAPVGVNKFSVHYKQKNIFEDDLEVEKGNMYEITNVAQHPDEAGERAYFQYNNKLYTVFLNSEIYHLDIWDPATNQWERKPVPEDVELRIGSSGLEISGKIYFYPDMYHGGYVNGSYVPRQERIYSYDPVNDVWDSVILYSTLNTNEMTHPLATFVYQNKLYCFVDEVRYPEGSVEGEGKRLLKVFDPADRSWETVMELDGRAWGYRAVVIQGKIYVLETQKRNQYSATTDFKYVLYELDLASKTWTEKGTPIFYTLEKGAMDPAIFDYKGRLYIYGGESSIGYLGYGTTDLYEYSPEANMWTMLFLSPNHDLPCIQHFSYVLNGKVYFGLGLTARSESSNDIWELDLE